MRTAILFLMTACVAATESMMFVQPAAHRPARLKATACRAQNVWPGGMRPGGFAKEGWAKHDKAVFDATLHGWDRHDDAVFSEVAAFDVNKAWDAHDQAVFAHIENLAQHPQSTAAKRETSLLSVLALIFDFWTGLPKPFAAKWARHDAEFVAQLENLQAAWATHDEALFEQTMAVLEKGPAVLSEGWERHDEELFEQTMAVLEEGPATLSQGWERHDAAVFSAVYGESQRAPQQQLKLRRQLARTQSNLQEMTTTLVRGLDGGFDEDALSYSV